MYVSMLRMDSKTARPILMKFPDNIHLAGDIGYTMLGNFNIQGAKQGKRGESSPFLYLLNLLTNFIEIWQADTVTKCETLYNNLKNT